MDLLGKDFMRNYETWVHHGEGNDSDLTRFGLEGYNASNDDPSMNSWGDNVFRYEFMVADAFPQFEPIQEDEEGEEHYHDPNPEANRFYQLLQSVRKPLWEVSGLVREVAATSATTSADSIPGSPTTARAVHRIPTDQDDPDYI
ncbi:hypothetical protein PIB30_014951 [Stylosanthes scabra]|uniref:Uncharacterized protein n=1 Tax=Stylosanthes scabra TaxID=79078 RepID=A0ABU6W6Z2_9FABA|nr:hypothetical protein [Stylosanthes scabra]